MSLGLEAYAVDGAIHFPNLQDFLQLVTDRTALREINRFAAE